MQLPLLQCFRKLTNEYPEVTLRAQAVVTQAHISCITASNLACVKQINVACLLLDLVGLKYSFSRTTFLVPVMDEALQMSGGWKQGPIWVSKGERFSPCGAYDFFISIALSFKESMSQVEQGLELVRFFFFSIK